MTMNAPDNNVIERLRKCNPAVTSSRTRHAIALLYARSTEWRPIAYAFSIPASVARSFLVEGIDGIRRWLDQVEGQ